MDMFIWCKYHPGTTTGVSIVFPFSDNTRPIINAAPPPLSGNTYGSSVRFSTFNAPMPAGGDFAHGILHEWVLSWPLIHVLSIPEEAEIKPQNMLKRIQIGLV